MMRPQSARDNTEIHFQPNRISIRRFVCFFFHSFISLCYFCRELEIAYVIWKIIMTSKWKIIINTWNTPLPSPTTLHATRHRTRNLVRKRKSFRTSIESGNNGYDSDAHVVCPSQPHSKHTVCWILKKIKINTRTSSWKYKKKNGTFFLRWNVVTLHTSSRRNTFAFFYRRGWASM